MIEKVIYEIKKRESFMLTTHVNPEGDAIGSTLAMAIALSSAGKKVRVLTVDPVPKFLRFLPSSEIVEPVEKIEDRFDAVMTIDCGELDRVKLFTKDSVPGDILINIDHHVTNKGFGDVNLIKDVVASAELVYEIIKRLGIFISSNIATCLYTAIMTETGSFRYSNTNLRAFEMAEELIKAGADPWQIAENVYSRNTPGRLKLLAEILSGLELNEDKTIAWITIVEDMYKRTNTTKEDVEDFINYPRSIEGVEVAVLFRETNHDWKVSFRSNGRIDVARIAVEFGGGGHKMASGCTLTGTLQDVQAKVISRLEEAIEEGE